jgi:hypothetical protein
MRPHPMLAITSATVVLGAAAAIGVARTSGPSTPLARTTRHHGEPRLVARVRQPLPVLPRAVTAIVAGVYRTTPLPYLFAHREQTARPAVVASIAVAVSHSSAASPSQWRALRLCESNDDYVEDTGNGYYGAYQFAASTWWSLGLPGLPYEASPAVQNSAAAKLQRLDGWSAWPVCSAAVGL